MRAPLQLADGLEVLQARRLAARERVGARDVGHRLLELQCPHRRILEDEEFALARRLHVGPARLHRRVLVRVARGEQLVELVEEAGELRQDVRGGGEREQHRAEGTEELEQGGRLGARGAEDVGGGGGGVELGEDAGEVGVGARRERLALGEHLALRGVRLQRLDEHEVLAEAADAGGRPLLRHLLDDDRRPLRRGEVPAVQLLQLQRLQTLVERAHLRRHLVLVRRLDLPLLHNP